MSLVPALAIGALIAPMRCLPDAAALAPVHRLLTACPLAESPRPQPTSTTSSSGRPSPHPSRRPRQPKGPLDGGRPAAQRVAPAPAVAARRSAHLRRSRKLLKQSSAKVGGKAVSPNTCADRETTQTVIRERDHRTAGARRHRGGPAPAVAARWSAQHLRRSRNYSNSHPRTSASRFFAVTAHLSAKQRAEFERLCAKLH